MYNSWKIKALFDALTQSIVLPGKHTMLFTCLRSAHFSNNPSNAAHSVLRVPAALTLGAALLLAACGQSAAPPGAGGPGAAMPPAEVGVVTVMPGDVGLITELPGRLEASRLAQVRARAAGILQKRLFIEGSDVAAGQALFQIDAGPYEASLASALANVAKAEANLMQASAQAERFKPLVQAKAISEQDFINAQAAQKLAQADLAVARAAEQVARINLGYASITAPIAGRIGRALVTEGALVGQGEATQLAVIQQIDPMYVNFTQSAAEVMALRRAMDAGKLKRVGSQAASVKLLLEPRDGLCRSRQSGLRCGVGGQLGIEIGQRAFIALHDLFERGGCSSSGVLTTGIGIGAASVGTSGVRSAACALSVGIGRVRLRISHTFLRLLLC